MRLALPSGSLCPGFRFWHPDRNGIHPRPRSVTIFVPKYNAATVPNGFMSSGCNQPRTARGFSTIGCVPAFETQNLGLLRASVLPWAEALSGVKREPASERLLIAPLNTTLVGPSARATADPTSKAVITNGNEINILHDCLRKSSRWQYASGFPLRLPGDSRFQLAPDS